MKDMLTRFQKFRKKLQLVKQSLDEGDTSTARQVTGELVADLGDIAPWVEDMAAYSDYR